MSEGSRMKSIAAVLRECTARREVWFEHVRTTATCWCGANLDDPIAEWHSKHLACADARPRVENSVGGDSAPRKAAVALIQRSDGRVLCVWNLRYDGFSLPGGMVEEGETTEDALRRELREETSLEVATARFLFEGKRHLRPKMDSRGGRASVVAVYHVTAIGEPREVEPGCRADWLTWDEFLAQSPFGDFYRAILPTLTSDDSLVRGLREHDALTAKAEEQRTEGPTPNLNIHVSACLARGATDIAIREACQAAYEEGRRSSASSTDADRTKKESWR